jgi:hypothetical protein
MACYMSFCTDQKNMSGGYIPWSRWKGEYINLRNLANLSFRVFTNLYSKNQCLSSQPCIFFFYHCQSDRLSVNAALWICNLNIYESEYLLLLVCIYFSLYLPVFLLTYWFYVREFDLSDTVLSFSLSFSFIFDFSLPHVEIFNFWSK